VERCQAIELVRRGLGSRRRPAAATALGMRAPVIAVPLRLSPKEMEPARELELRAVARTLPGAKAPCSMA
jgi:hypothetical protein